MSGQFLAVHVSLYASEIIGIEPAGEGVPTYYRVLFGLAGRSHPVYGWTTTEDLAEFIFAHWREQAA